MARVNNAIFEGTYKQAYAANANQPMLDLTYGGQFGWSPNLTEWVSNQAYVRKQLIPILLEAPKFFMLMPNPDKWVSSLKALVEVHPKSIDGLKAGLEVETEGHAVGGAGEQQLEVTNVTRERSVVRMSWQDKYGAPINTFWEQYITYGMMHPETKYAMVGTLGTPPSDLLADWFTFSMLFIEPDPTHRRVVRSWVTTNLFPQGSGEVEGKRDMTGAGELADMDIELGGISQYNLGTNVFAQSILDTINITGANPYLKASFINGTRSGIDPNVAQADHGYAEGIQNVVSNHATGL